MNVVTDPQVIFDLKYFLIFTKFKQFFKNMTYYVFVSNDDSQPN